MATMVNLMFIFYHTHKKVLWELKRKKTRLGHIKPMWTRNERSLSRATHLC